MTTQAYAGMKGAALLEWRRKQPGRFRARNGQSIRGWSQIQAAKWYGCSVRQWQRFESGECEVPLPLVRRIQAHRATFEDVVDSVFDTADEEIEKWGGVIEPHPLDPQRKHA